MEKYPHIESIGNCQYIIKENENICFQSYNSLIAVYNKQLDQLTLGSDWDYSITTLKHLYKFIKEYTCFKPLSNLDYEFNKKAFIQDLIDKDIIKYDRYMQ